MTVKKLLVDDGRSEREVLLIGTIVVGRDPACQLHDLDPLLSRRHAEFVPSSSGVIVRDLKSRNGILVNGDKVPEHVLKPGDVVQLGHLHVRYVEEPVVKSPEDHRRVRAKTETGIEAPATAPVVKPVAPVPMVAAAAGPTSMTLIPMPNDETDLHVTVAPTDWPQREDDDADATRLLWGEATAVAEDPDATTVVSWGHAFEDTRMTAIAKSHAPAAPAQTAPSTEARVVANMSLIVTEASPSCQTVVGARPETIVGGGLSDFIARTLRFVATGDGPSALSMSIARATSGNTITVTFRTGQATESHS